MHNDDYINKRINNIIFFIKISTATHFKTAHTNKLLLLSFMQNQWMVYLDNEEAIPYIYKQHSRHSLINNISLFQCLKQIENCMSINFRHFITTYATNKHFMRNRNTKISSINKDTTPRFFTKTFKPITRNAMC